ncbi:serine/threonine-protein phosphatase 2A activator [Drosophila hydei]|uniref:Serine/threonine-protein phosphatase 2A activator n=1 Tax=Drosophila hydei TaxID=7224 RepID=A0A6J1LV42_DROHY|nr:serine/threonine-protein phosphatase 2A activator [Drosophila hydei]
MNIKRKYNVDDPTEDALKASIFAQQIYTKPVRKPEDLGKWRRSHAYSDLVAYINNTSMAIQGHTQDGNDFIVSSQMSKLCKIFNWLDRLVYECHPLGVGQGMLRCVGEDRINVMESTVSLRHKCHHAYRHWVKLVQERVYSILERQIKPHCKHINELAQYLTRSFGSLHNFDYGPGHELMFVFYLCSLFKAGILGAEDTIAAALLLYQRYLDLVRHLTSFFRLAPSYKRDNNVIDDRNVLPYIWGCAQLCRKQPFAPPQWEQPEIMSAHRKSYMLLSSLEHLQKTMNYAALGVHSYQLWCVLSLSNWPDAYDGLMGTYVKSVLNDFCTVQDLVFCEMLSVTRQPFEYLQRAFLGEDKEEASSLSTEDTDQSDEDEESDLQLLDSRHLKAIKKKEMRHTRAQILSAACPPISLHNNLRTDVFLGFKNPSKLSSEPDAVSANVLRRPRLQSDVIRRDSTAQILANEKSNPNKKRTSIESGNSAMLKKLTNSYSEQSYYTI